MPAVYADAGEEKEAGKAVLAKCGDSVVTVKATVKVRMVVGGSEQMKDESEVETLATVIDPSGLSVMSFSTIDPTRLYSGILKKMKAAGDGPQMNLDSDVTGITMVFPDGREIPAKVVLRDGDLDIAFIKPTEKQEKPFTGLDLTSDAKPEVLDTIFIVTRLDRSAGRGLSISVQRVEAIIAAPRKFYISESSSLMGKLGAPVFTADGKIAGFSILRVTKSGDSSRMGGFLAGGTNSLGIMSVILPASDVANVAKQAMGLKDQ